MRKFTLICLLALASTPPKPSRAADATQALVATLSNMSLPSDIPLLPARRLDATCDEAGAEKIMGLIDAHQLSDRSGSIVLAGHAQACHWVGTQTGRLIASHYQAVASDQIGLAVIGLVFGAITADDYAGVARAYLTKLAAGDQALSVATAALALDFAAGACTSSLNATCLRATLERFRPAQWHLDAQSSLAFGDIFRTPIPQEAAGNAVTVSAFVVRAGLPIRRDLLDQLDRRRAEILAARRTQFYQYAFGEKEEL